ncbi:hypothetical protein [Acidovorax sp.]|uniref:hypothetical protein n=1 Tax=Acidovorax sp. TaxID=1872122 RepID=UPI00391EEDDC
MNWPFAIAGSIACIVAVVHSVLGERWVFRRMRHDGAIPTNGGNVLREPHVRILWASWHIVSVLGLALAACLFYLAAAVASEPAAKFFGSAVAISMLISSVLVFVGTSAKHVGWLGLLLVALFSAWGVLK